MLKGAVLTVLCIFSSYGFVKFFISLRGMFKKLFEEEKAKRHTVIFLKDNQKEAEVIIRETVLGRNPFCGDIIAVDRGSADETAEILKRLAREYEILRVMSFEEYLDYIKEE